MQTSFKRFACKVTHHGHSSVQFPLRSAGQIFHLHICVRLQIRVLEQHLDVGIDVFESSAPDHSHEFHRFIWCHKVVESVNLWTIAEHKLVLGV